MAQPKDEMRADLLQVDLQTPVDAYYPVNAADSMEVRRLKFSPASFQNRNRLALRTEIAQGYGIIVQGMIMARHVFRGLKRGVYDGSDENQGPKKLAYSWRPAYDCLWLGDKFSGRIERVNPPKDRVFVVIVSPNSAVNVGTPAGWINRWNWVYEDELLKEAPIDWQKRYDRKIWTRQ